MIKSRLLFSCWLISVVPAAQAAASSIYTFDIAITVGQQLDGKQVVGYGFPALSDAGDVAFSGVLKQGQVQEGCIAISSAGALTLVAKKGDVVSGKTLESFGLSPSLNTAGTVAYNAHHAGGDSVFTQNGKIAGTGDTVDGKLLTFAAGPSINNAGVVAFDGGFAGKVGIFTPNHLVVATGDTVSGHVLTALGQQDLNDSGQVSMTATFSSGRAIYLNNALLAATGDTIAGKTIDTPGNPSLNNAGNVVFVTTFDGGTGIFTKDSLLVTEGVTTDGKTLSAIGTPVWNDAEQVLFPGIYSGGRGYFMYDHGSLSSVATIGTTIDGSTITDLSLGDFHLNEAGQISFGAALADGRTVYVVASPTPVPEPHALILVLVGLLAIRSSYRRKLRST